MARDGKRIHVWYTSGGSDSVTAVTSIEENETHYWIHDRYGNTKRLRKKNVKRIDANGVDMEPRVAED